MKIGILGAGSIAGTLAETMNKMPEVECYGVASRDLEKAKSFAKEHGFAHAFGSYEGMLADEEIELVYIATPHSHHYQHMRMCLDAGKHILCEKSFTVNAKQAEEIFRIAEKKKLLVTEAIWTRYMPSRKMINDLLAEKVIGEVSKLTANLNYPLCDKERIVKPELAGGALLDVGIYPLNFAYMHFGDGVNKMISAAQLTDAGVDGENAMVFLYEDGRMAVLNSGIHGKSDSQGVFYGSVGCMVVENINNPEQIRIYDRDRNLLREVDVPEQISGYEYEITETIACIKEGKLECPSMPHSETIRMMRIMDSLRSEWGVRYPETIEKLMP
ncbi:MAG: Gfo/Idh/MocA family oxidoreductase [Bacteroidales bacterium]|nr:Gfo/Idh/MocA family oxidoreductase [Bacteroidales bacterium]MCM1415970.1 Gfo/Idh/MocA family oxidoreductase [bacterium]MCM1422761.1 Gfo/Idh/MocA family oxidoreductase [bacterium]